MSDQKPVDPANPEDSKETLEIGSFEDHSLHDVHAQLMREKEEPSEGFSPMPIFLIFLCGALVFFCGIYIAHYSAGFDPLAYDETVDPKGPPPAPPPYDKMAHGKKVFNNCVACHQSSGAGLPGVYPTLHGSEWIHGDEGRMIAIILNGISGPIEVKGESYNSAMTPFGSLLDDKEIAAVATYVRTNAEWGNSEGEVTEEKVAEIRAAYQRGTPWSADELKKIFPLEN